MLKIFIGFLFEFIDFNIYGFDIAADFIGHILVYLGLNEYPDIASFQKAKPYTIVLLIKSLIFTILGIFIKADNSVFMIVSAVLAIAFAVVTLCQLYHFAKGMGELEEKTGLDLSYQKLFSLWNKRKYAEILLAVLGVATSVFALNNVTADNLSTHVTEPLTMLIFSVITIIAGILAIMMLVIDIKQLVCVYKAKEALDTYQPEEAVRQDYEQPTEE